MTTATEATRPIEEAVPMQGAWKNRIALAELDQGKDRPPIEVLRRGAGLYGLLRSGTITQRHVDAAQRWARDFETGIMGASDPERRGSGAGDAHDNLIARAEAVTRCENIRRTFGRYASDILILLVLDGLSLGKIAEHYGKNRQGITGAAELVLEQLADYYEGTLLQ